MLKILYVAGNRDSSFYSLNRFIDTYKQFYNIKIAAYSRSIKNINVNWNLDCLLDFTHKRNTITFNNSNYNLFKREVKRFGPDIIISDLELYSSFVAIELGIKLWQLSPVLLHYGTTESYDIYKKYSYIFYRDVDYQNLIKKVLNYSDRKFILSHLGDSVSPPVLKDGFEWLRPNYIEMNSNARLQASNAINLADLYFSGKGSSTVIDFRDQESIVTGIFNKARNLSTFSDKYQEFIVKTNINPDVKFLSQYLSSIVI